MINMNKNTIFAEDNFASSGENPHTLLYQFRAEFYA